MRQKLSYFISDARPAAELWLLDDDDTLIDMSGYTFSLKIGNPGEAALFTKTTGITGAAGSGQEPTGVPNVVISWTAGELSGSQLVAGETYAFILTATLTALPRSFAGVFECKKVMT